jgi:hypothetical protein
MLTKILGHSPKTTIAGLLAAAAGLWHDASIRSVAQALLIAALGRLTQDSHGKP